MKNESQELLEQFIDAELKRLPNVKAPPDLAAKVLGRIHAQPASWWQAGWMHWPWSLRIAAVVVIAALTAYCARGFAEIGLGWTLSIMAENTGDLLNQAWGWLKTVGPIIRPIRNQLLLNLVVLLLMAPLAIGAGRTIWALTLKEEK